MPDRMALEVRQRRRNIIILAAVIVVGCLLPAGMPVFKGLKDPYPRRGEEPQYEFDVKWSLPNFMVLGQKEVPAGTKWLLFYPLLAGLGAAGAACLLANRHRERAASLVGLGTVLVVLLLVSEDSRLMFEEMFGGSDRDSSPLLPALVGVLNVLAVVALYVGCRARWHRPESTTAYTFGLVGAILLAASLLFPGLRPEAGLMLIAAPVKLMSRPGCEFFGFAGLVHIVGAAVAAAICLSNTPQLLPRVSRARAGIAFWLLVGSWMFYALGVLATFHSAFGQHTGGAVAAALVFSLVKFGMMVGGTLLLLPFGLTDLVVGPPQAVPQATQPVAPATRAARPPSAAAALANLAPPRPAMKPKLVRRKDDSKPDARP